MYTILRAHVLVLFRHVKCIQKLLESKANIEISNSDGMTAVSDKFESFQITVYLNYFAAGSLGCQLLFEMLYHITSAFI